MLKMVSTPPYDTHTAIQTVTNTVLATPNVVFEVCVWPPKVANQWLAILRCVAFAVQLGRAMPHMRP